MHGRTLWMGVWLLALVVGCGDSADDGADAGDAVSDAGPNAKKDGGGGGAGRSGDKDGGDTSTTGGTGGSGGTGGESTSDMDGGVELCGAVTCVDPACCADPFQSLCGVGAGRACLMPPTQGATDDPRCPPFAIGSFDFASCCTDSGDCGLNVEMFGAGCISLSSFKAAAESMGAPAGLGVPDDQKCD